MEQCHVLWFQCIQHTWDGILSLAGCLLSCPMLLWHWGGMLPWEQVFLMGGGYLSVISQRPLSKLKYGTLWNHNSGCDITGVVPVISQPPGCDITEGVGVCDIWSAPGGVRCYAPSHTPGHHDAWVPLLLHVVQNLDVCLKSDSPAMAQLWIPAEGCPEDMSNLFSHLVIVSYCPIYIYIYI